MTPSDLLDFARGPALWFSLLVLVTGSAWRIIAILRLGTKPDLSEPRRRRRFGALRGIFRQMVLRKEFRHGGILGAFNGYLYHLGLVAIAFGYLPHILFVKRLTGFAWPPLPEPLFYLAAGGTIIALVIVLFERLTHPVLRMLSGFDDYFSWCVVFLPLLTGMAALGGSTATGAPLYPLPLAIHLLSVELLFLWLPFGKLAHGFLVFMSRGVTGAALARRGASL